MGVPRRWNPSTVAPPVGRYSHLVEVPADHRLGFVSGQVGNLPDGSLAGHDAASQTRQALANIEALLAAAGATPASLVRLQTFVAGTDQLAGFREAFGAVYARWFPDGAIDFPGHSLLVVQALAAPEYRVEIEAWFAVPAAS